MRKLIVALVAAMAVPPVAGAAAPGVRVHALPGAAAFPESIGADPRTGAFYTGSLIDGTVFRGTLDAPQAEVFLPAGSDGRTNVAGVKVDRTGRIWIADAFNARVLVYDAAGTLLHVFLLEGPGTPTVNDLAFSHGSVYVTDSARPFLYRISEADAGAPGTTSVEPWLAVDPPVAYATGEGPLGVNLNGIVASPDGSTLLTIQTNTGTLYRVDVASGTIAPVDTGAADLQFGDGMLLAGDDLYLARNAADRVVRLELGRGWTSARVVEALAEPSFAFPTALAELHGRLLVTNAQLNATADPSLPFTVVDLPLRSA
jgi:Cu-Zn family superoxide dismutase